MENSNLKMLLLAIIVILSTLILMRLTNQGGVRQEVTELERSQSARLAREIIEEGKVPNEIRGKYTAVVQPTLKSPKGSVIANDILVLPPYSRARISLKTYCLDRPLPAPASGEKLHLIDVSQLLIKEFIPIYEKLMQYSALHPEANLQVQRIVWFMRFLSEDLYVPSYDLVYEDKELLEGVYPGSTEIIENQKRRIFLKQEILKGLNILLQNLPEEVKEVLRVLKDLGYDVANPPGNLEVANRIVSRTLEIINSMSPIGVVVEDSSEYTLLPNDIAVKTEHPGGADGTILTVANPTPVNKTMDFKRYALKSGRKVQRLGIGGIKSVEWEQTRWKEVIRPPAARPLPVLTSPLLITPVKDVYDVGESLEATFTIKNVGSVAITLDVLTVGGRLNGLCPEDDGCPDFTHRSVTLKPLDSYRYKGNLVLTKPGSYRFFVAYHINNPTPAAKMLLDENNWNTCVELGEGLTHTDRVRNIVVGAKEIYRLEESISRWKNYYSRYQYPSDLRKEKGFRKAVANKWADLTSFITRTDLTKKYYELYNTGIEYHRLSAQALADADRFLQNGDVETARRYLNRSYLYEKLSGMSFAGAFEVFDGNLRAAEILAKGIFEGCEAALRLGVKLIAPSAAPIVDAILTAVDVGFELVVEREGLGKVIAKQVLSRAISKGLDEIIGKVKFLSLGNDTLVDYVNRVHETRILDQLLENKEFMTEFGDQLREVIIKKVAKESAKIYTEELLIKSLDKVVEIIIKRLESLVR